MQATRSASGRTRMVVSGGSVPLFSASWRASSIVRPDTGSMRTVGDHLQIGLRGVGDGEHAVGGAFQTRPQRVACGGGITAGGKRSPERQVAQHALNQHHDGKSG